MCNDQSWKSCSKVTSVFTSLLVLGMIIAVGVMNSMFGGNMQCYVDASKKVTGVNDYSRRQLFEGMDKIAAQHTGGDGIARGKLDLFNIAQAFGLDSAVKQLSAFAPEEGRKLSETTPPNDNSCNYGNSAGVCDDGALGWCACGTDLNDCGVRVSLSDCTRSTTTGLSEKTDEQKVAEVEKVRCPPPTLLRVPPCFPAVPHCALQPPTIPRCPRAQAVLNVFNPAMIIPAIFCALLLYIGSGLTLKNVTEPPTVPAALLCLLH